MVTKHEAMTAQEFHYGTCKRTVGPRGGVKEMVERWRRSGATKTWVTRPDEFRTPIKFGLYQSSYLDHTNAGEFHTAESCPLNQPYQPKTGVPCSCKPGVYRDNCPSCEGTGMQIDFAAIRARRTVA